jgi:hypothetical protein
MGMLVAINEPSEPEPARSHARAERWQIPRRMPQRDHLPGLASVCQWALAAQTGFDRLSTGERTAGVYRRMIVTARRRFCAAG